MSSSESVEIDWYIARDGEQHGPITSAQLHDLYATQRLASTDQIWSADMENWAPVSEVLGPPPVPVKRRPPPIRYRRQAAPLLLSRPGMIGSTIVSRSMLPTRALTVRAIWSRKQSSKAVRSSFRRSYSSFSG